MDRRQSIAESAVEASKQLFPERRLCQAWEPVVSTCYAASAAYLAATESENDPRWPLAPGAPSNSFDAAREQLIAASRRVDEFYNEHRAHLEHAHALLSAVPAEAQQAVAVADAARQRVDAVGAPFVNYSSVQTSGAGLDGAMGTLNGALAARNAKQIREAAAEVRSAAAAVEQAVLRAPDQERAAAQGLVSVTTRMAAVATRAEGLAPALSSLLREFNAASSADLTNNEHSSRLIMAEAEADLAAARTALAHGDPERASALTSAVRAHLARAEELVDVVTDRLILLRSVRDNPKAMENEVRFKLRDAQMLAVTRGVVQEWASVLDAQVGRIDRIVGQLNGRNPDYWGYVSGLDAVSTFISGVVQRMRTESVDGTL